MKQAAFFKIARVLLLLLAAAPARAAGTQMLHGQMPSAVAQLQPINRMAATQRLNLAIALPLRNSEALTNLLADLYNPASPHFHQFLTPGQFAEQFGPTEQDYEAVIAFAKAQGLSVTSTYPNRTLVDVSGPVAEIESTFHVHLQVYQHPTETRTFFAPDAEPSLDLSVPVLSVSGLDNYVLPHPMNVKFKAYDANSNAIPYTASGSGPRGNFIGKDFRTAYAPGVTLNGAGQAVGLFELDGYFPNDIAHYESLAGLPSVPLTNVLVDGVSGSAGSGNIEVSLDIDMVVSMAPGLSRVIVFEGSTPDDVLNRMATDTNNFARQLTCSWGFGVSVDANRDQIFQEYAAQGQSFFQASGDDGAWSGVITPPSDNPFVTVVGGTSLTLAGLGESWVSETTWPLSGGGVSTAYTIPVWQQGVITTATQGSTKMRNIPDVAAQADTDIWLIANNGEEASVGGTSASAQLWGGFMALVNQQAAATGKPSPGFLNPAIYTLGQSSGYTAAFHDITTGNNTDASSPTKFSALSGYDLCTGWGTPTGSNLISALLANPDALLITPPTNVTAFGAVGGPFSQTSQNYSLITFGTNAVPWTLANMAAWLTVSPTNGTIPVGGPATTVTFSLNSAANNLTPGSYVAVVWFTNLNDGFAQSRQFTLNVITPPMITSQPSNQNVVPGGTATFMVGTAPDAQLFFAWRKNSNNLTDGGNISGSATSTLTVANVSAADAGTYSVIVSNALGSIPSAGAMLTVVSLTTPGVTTATLYSFTGGNDGGNPNGLIQSASGEFYGTTQSGGTNASGDIFQWMPAGNPANLYSFTGGNDGSHPQDALLQTPDGTLYGTTFDGGTDQNGTVFKVTTNGAFASLLSFLGANGDLPYDQLAFGPDGNLYGTTYQGGGFGVGSVFKMTTNGSLTTVVSFNTNNGDFPYAGLTVGQDGNLYGTTFRGGVSDEGTIFKLGTNGLFNTLFSFRSTNGTFPYAGLTQDEFGNFYGVTGNGGASNNGVVFKLTPTGAFSTLYNFTGGADGSLPAANLAQGNDGNFYGATVFGGAYGDGTVFRLGADGTFTTLLQFDGFNGAHPYATLTQGSDGNLYGTAENGGAAGEGVIFQLTLGGQLEIAVQPQSQTVFSGATVVLSVATTGGLPQSYQWQENGTNLADGGNVSGANGRVLTINNISPGNVGIYTVTVSNAASGAIISDDAIIEVLVSPPIITLQPVGQTVSPGATVTFNVNAIGSLPLIYHWRQNGTNLTDGGNLFGSGTSSLTIPSVTEANAGVYSVVVSNFITSATSTGAVLTVIPNTAPGTRFTTLHSFAGGTDGSKPSELTPATDGSLLGTTQFGGAGRAGSVFKVATNGSVSTIASFGQQNLTGFGPTSGVAQGLDGNFYGVTQFGGFNDAGNVFMMTPGGTLTNIYSFSGGLDGNSPIAPLVRGPDGSFYGSTTMGGNFGVGNIFRVTPGGALTLLHSFTGEEDGFAPTNALAFGLDGNLYGMTEAGGVDGKGNIFRLTTNGVFTTVYSFTGGTDGSAPNGPLALGSDGNFYGTTRHSTLRSFQFYGTIFKVTPGGALTTLYTLNLNDGHYPAAGVIQSSDGNFYGTIEFGGTVNNNGTLFLIAPNGTPSTLVNFDGFDEGAHPETPLTLGLDGNLYGTTSTGGPGGQGNVFRFSASAMPQITTSPASQTPFVGATVSLSVAAFGSQPLAYQWLDNSNRLTDGGNLSGSAARILTLTNVITNNTGNYSVIVTNSLGAATSAVAVVTVLSAGPLIVSAPPAKETALPGTTISFTVTANGNMPLSFQWLKNGTNLTDGVTPGSSIISGSATGTLTLANLAQSDAGTYSILVTNALGSATNLGTALTMTPVAIAGNTLASLYSFNDLNDGALPNGLALGSNGVIYGTAEGGGLDGAGTIFALGSNGAPVGLYDFTDGSDGAFPLAPLLPAADGNFYGSANSGGDFDGGTVFAFATNASFTTLHAFDGDSDSTFPEAQLTAGEDGFFYGTTFGASNFNGAVFKVSPGGVFSNLYTFSGGDDGGQPQSPLVRGTDGNFYGATDIGGSNGFGTIFRITTNGVLTNIYTFNGVADGAQPVGLILRPDGSFYGVTFTGGSNNTGVIFRLTSGGAFTTLFTFGAVTNSTNGNGANPIAGLTPASDGNLYGSAVNGGIFGDGTLFKLSPTGAFTTLAWFDGFNGAHPEAPMVQGTDGDLYGTTVVGGPGGVGTIFRLGISPQPALRVLTKFHKNSTNEDFTFSWNSVAGRNYQLQATTNFNTTNWTSLGAPFAATNSITTATVMGAFGLNEQQFYRVILLP